ncbi:putative metal ion transporter C17A12.14 [Hypsizygus marmoreus]|uniref:Metal ion transporter C17A12.14 n=1 Tax=Hypsizygus marmoreus TaxID=39966 RepID=A0A369JJA8_HYPMA|nr:putative metal ion transporter C17A12.14 [Hypsizygus marmoreus]
MSAPRDGLSGSAISSSPDTARESVLSGSPTRRRASDASDLTRRRHSPTLVRSFDPEARERQRTMDVDMAMQLSRARRETISISPEITPLPERNHEEEEERPHILSPTDDIDEETAIIPDNTSRIDLDAHLHQGHDPSLLAHSQPIHGHQDTNAESLFGLPTYQANVSRSEFDFGPMEQFAAAEKATLGLTSPTTKFSLDPLRSSRRIHVSPPVEPEPSAEAGPSSEQPSQPPGEAGMEDATRPSMSMRHRKLSQSNTHPRTHRKGIGGKMALFETPHDFFSPPSAHGTPSLSARLGLGRHQHQEPNIFENLVPGAPPLGGGILHSGHDRPYRFSFYSNSLAATIHARSLSELPAEGQSFEQLFVGIHTAEGNGAAGSEFGATGGGGMGPPPPSFAASRPQGGDRFSNAFTNGVNGSGARRPPDLKIGADADGNGDSEDKTWWLDVTSPTDEEMKMLSKVFSIHPLTTEDIQMEETREKIELFRNYYLVCFRSFDQDQYSPTYLEPLNMYIIVFREGILSFHFRPTSHPQNVRRRIKQLKDYISVTSDWISYALIDDITDAFGPLIQSIEYEVDSIDELVLILKEAEQSDMLRRIGTCRKKVMGLLRLMGNKADVVKGLAKRCNENWRIAPTSDIGLYLSDIQDHLITMTQNLNHYEKILSRSHSNYLAQISIEMTDANNQINDVLSKLTALGTVLIPMNLITGLWGMNVHVPGEGVEGYAWFISIVAGLAAFALIGGYSTYRFMIGRS